MSDPPTSLGVLARLGLLVGPLLSMVDSSVVNVAVSEIGHDLNADLRSVAWVVSAYLLALAAGLASTSYLARRFGTLQVYLTSLVGFLIASAACAAAPTVGALVLARCAQGLLGAPLVPLAMTVLLGGGNRKRHMPAETAVLFFLAPALGPSLAGGLIAAGNWRFIFLVNLPVGLLGLWGLSRIPVDTAPGPQRGARFDPMGLAMLAGGVTLGVYGATQGGSTRWASMPTVLPLAGGVLLLTSYAWWAPRRDQPAVDLGLLRRTQSSLALGLSVVSAVVAFATVFMLPVFTQSVQHYSALVTGLALLPQGVVTGVGAALGQRLLTRITTRTMVLTGFLLLTATSACLLLLTADTPLWITAAILSGRGLGVGVGIAPLLYAMLKPLTDAELADGNTLFNIVQRLGGSLGVGLIGSLLTGRTPIVGTIGAFHEVALVLVLIAAVALASSALLTPIRQPAHADPAVD